MLPTGYVCSYPAELLSQVIPSLKKYNFFHLANGMINKEQKENDNVLEIQIYGKQLRRHKYTVHQNMHWSHLLLHRLLLLSFFYELIFQQWHDHDLIGSTWIKSSNYVHDSIFQHSCDIDILLTNPYYMGWPTGCQAHISLLKQLC